MSYNIAKDIYDTLTSDSNLLSLVSSGNIQIGWKREPPEYPSITFYQVAGYDRGQMGYSVLPSGSKTRTVIPVYGFTIFSRSSMKEILQIDDALTKCLIKKGFEKLSDREGYDDEINAYVKLLTYRKKYFLND